MSRDITSDMTLTQAKSTAKDKVRNITYNLDDLIDSDDVQEGADSWEDVDPETLDEEIRTSIGVIFSEGGREETQIRDELAYHFIRANLMRVPREDLSDELAENEKKAVREGYWYNEMDKFRVMEILHELGLDEAPKGYVYLEEAEEVLHDAFYEALNPLDEKPV